MTRPQQAPHFKMPERRTSQWLLWCGLAGPALFVVALLVEGAIRQDYDSARMFGSLLSIGNQGWQQVTNFVISGLLIVLFAFGLRPVVRNGPASRSARREYIIGAVGLGLMGPGCWSPTRPSAIRPGGATGPGHRPTAVVARGLASPGVAVSIRRTLACLLHLRPEISIVG